MNASVGKLLDVQPVKRSLFLEIFFRVFGAKAATERVAAKREK